jgi:hypothetical protein
MTGEIDLRAIADKLEIHEVLVRYCRAIDRGDPELLASVYHEGAVDRHGQFQFTDARTQFPPVTVPRLDAMRGVAQHHMTNWLIELDGEAAAVESYFIAFQPVPHEDGREVRTFVGGRYLDRFERRDGRWAIVERSVVLDWTRGELGGEEWPAAAGFPAPGRREADPSHELFGSDRP